MRVVCSRVHHDAQTQEGPVLLLLAQPLQKHAWGLKITCVGPDPHCHLIDIHFTGTHGAHVHWGVDTVLNTADKKEENGCIDRKCYGMRAMQYTCFLYFQVP